MKSTPTPPAPRLRPPPGEPAPETFTRAGSYGDRLEALLEISRSLSESLDVGVVMQTITEKAASLLGIPTTALYLLDHDSLYLGATTPPLPPEFPDSFRHARLEDHPHLREAVVTGAPVCLPDTTAVELTPAERAIAEARDLRTILYVPLRAERGTIGVLIVGCVGAPGTFSPDDVNLCLALAGQASLAVTNARLYGNLSRSVEELRRSEDRYRSLFHQATDGIMVMTTEGDIIDFNESFARMHGYTIEEMRTLALHDLDVPETARHIPSRMKRLMDGEALHVEIKHFHKDGRVIPLDVVAKRISLEDRDLILSFHRDLSDARQAEEERRKLEGQLQHAQRMESIGTLASGIAHDFNNILNIVLGNASILEESPGDAERVRQRAVAILKATDRGTQLVRQILTFARKSDPQFRITNMNALVKELAGLLEETFPRSIAIHLDLSPGLPSIVADPNQIHQVLLNLSINAKDAMPSGGEIRIATMLIPPAELAARFPAAPPTWFVEISVSDTGMGIDPATQNRIFDPFFSTKGIGKGTGLGLSVALGIIERHSGFIRVDTAPGAGSRFFLYLPVESGTDSGADTGESLPGKAVTGTETILLIEDEELIREMAVIAFRKRGYTLLTASDGEEGLETYLHNAASIAVVLSDRGLPKMSGEEVYARLRELKSTVPFFLLTGFIEAEEKTALLERGIRAVIQKPYMPDDVLRRIRETLDAGRTSSR